jgi:hypothetical protein
MKKLLFFLILFSLSSSKSYSFTLVQQNNSQFKGWANPEIKFALNLTNCPASVDVRSIVNDALAVWNNVASSRVKLSVVGDTTSTTLADPITIYCDINFGASIPGAANSSPGYAQHLPQTGDYITSGIMTLNASAGQANIANLSRSLVAVVLAHEIGHLIGLGHTQDLNALMYYDASLKNSLALSQDDIDGISYLYPRDETAGDKMMGCALVKSSSPPTPPWSFWLMTLPFLLIIALKFKALEITKRS